MEERHLRVVATVFGVEADQQATEMEAGEPQGCPASPIVWDLCEDGALAYAAMVRRNDAAGERVEEDAESMAFADDLAVTAQKKRCLQRTVQALIVVMAAVFGVRFNGAKSFYNRSLEAVAMDLLMGDGEGALWVWMLDTGGNWKETRLTSTTAENGDSCAARS